MVKFIDDQRGAHGVEPICEILPIAPATHYEHLATRYDSCPKVFLSAVALAATVMFWL